MTLRELALDAPALRDQDPFWTELLVRHAAQELERSLNASAHGVLKTERPTPDRIVVQRDDGTATTTLVDAPTSKLLAYVLFDEAGHLYPPYQKLLNEATHGNPKRLMGGLSRRMFKHSSKPTDPLSPAEQLCSALAMADPDHLKELFTTVQQRHRVVQAQPRPTPNKKENA